MSREQHIKVVIVEPMKPARVETIPNTLEELQRLVGGYVEPVREEGFDILINEDGKNLDLQPNFALYGGFDYIAGTAVFAGVNYSKGEWISLTESQIDFIKGCFKRRESTT